MMLAVAALVFILLGAACVGVWLATMNAKLFRHISYGAGLLALAFFTFATMAALQAAKAQQQQQRPLLQIQCTPIGSMSAATEYRLPFRGRETGYFWSIMRFSTGRLLIGFVTPAGDFCITDEAEEPPRT